MKMLTKILPLFLSVAPMTGLAMEVDDITKNNKRTHSSICAAEAEVERKRKAHKRQRTQEHKIIAAFEQEKFRSNLYKKIEDFKKTVDSLKELAPEVRELILGDDAESRFKDLEFGSEQLIERYYRNFFARVNSPILILKKIFHMML